MRIDHDFAGGAFARCVRLAPDRFRLTMSPEDGRLTNCSAWYAFRIAADRPTPVTVELDYSECNHRYWPKTSADGDAWTPLAESAVDVDPPAEVKEGEEWKTPPRTARLSLNAAPQPLFVSAQPLVLPADYEDWIAGMAARPNVTRGNVGSSVAGQPIDMVRIADGTGQRERVLLLGRQHPPETTGADALFAYVERLMEDDDLARAYRARFVTEVVPLMNPDGVARGHWRHNLGKLDLNRDWGPFTQPETRAVRDHTAAREAAGEKLRLIVDFHSTQRDVVYGLPDDEVTDPPGFQQAWLARYTAALPGYDVDVSNNHNRNSPVSKAWFHETYGIPTTTYEIGDTTEVATIRRISRAAAEAIMTTLLETPPAD